MPTLPVPVIRTLSVWVPARVVRNLRLAVTAVENVASAIPSILVALICVVPLCPQVLYPPKTWPEVTEVGDVRVPFAESNSTTGCPPKPLV